MLLLPLTAARSSIFLSTPSARRATHPALRRHRILRISIHALREEGDLLTCCSRSSRQCISIHALREEGDAKATEIEVEILNFYPRPPRGGRRVSGCEHHNLGRFLSTPSARRATGQHGGALRNHDISIHALREESDLPVLPEQPIGNEFLSTPSARRATSQCNTSSNAMPISIHALREEGDICCQQHSAHRPISIHALREEGDVSAHRWQGIQEHFYPRPPRGGRLNTNIANGFAGVFLSTPSARRATCILSFLMLLYQIFLSTPSARRATPASVGFAVAVFRFLSTPSARRATHNVDGAKRHRNISIHALREEGDSCILFEELLDLISIHALREEGDDLRHKGRARGSNFYPRPPRGGRRRREVALNVCKKISIHALREEGDDAGEALRVSGVIISIHALREEGDP